MYSYFAICNFIENWEKTENPITKLLNIIKPHGLPIGMQKELSKNIKQNKCEKEFKMSRNKKSPCISKNHQSVFPLIS